MTIMIYFSKNKKKKKSKLKYLNNKVVKLTKASGACDHPRH